MKTKPIVSFATTVVAALGLLSLAGCSSTSVDNTWTAPDVSKIHFNKIMVVATFPDGATRRIAEDAFKAEVKRAECITSYSVLGSEADAKNLDKISAAVKSTGVDGVVIIRPVSDKNVTSYVPGMAYPVPYRTFRGYYRAYAWSYYYEPGQVVTDRIVKLETNIYEMPGERLIWSGTTTSTNPDDIQELIQDATKAIREELVKEKLVPEPQS